jgi:MFS transporter, DHA2 family, multidrug resistance protein
MVGQLSPYNPQYQQALQSAAGALGASGNAAVAGQQAQGLMYGTLVQQSALWAYVETFRILALVCLICIPVVLLLKRVRPKEGAIAMH